VSRRPSGVRRLDDLERGGLVERVRDVRDRRRKALTAAGAAKLEELDARVQAAQDALLVPLPAAEAVS
jgi:DNA-binding MarR family transcriptional regulator